MISTADAANTAALCAVTTTIAAAAACVTAMFTDTLLDLQTSGEVSYDLTMAMNGALGGLVAITAGTSVVEPWAAFIIGAIGGLIYLFASKPLIKLKIDDAVDAIPVHFFNGAWGVIAAGLFAGPRLMAISHGVTDRPGAFYGDGRLLGVYICGVLFIIAWVVMTPSLLPSSLSVCSVLILLRKRLA